MQEKRILEPHRTHCGSLSRPVGWFSSIVLPAWLAAGILQAYGFTIGKLRQPTGICLHTLKVFRTKADMPTRFPGRGIVKSANQAVSEGSPLITASDRAGLPRSHAQARFAFPSRFPSP